MAIPTETLNTELDCYLTELSRDGWEVVSRAATSAQVRKKPRGVGCGIVGLILLPVALGYFIHPLFYALALIGLAAVGIALALRKDELRYITEDELVTRLLNR